MTIGLEDVYNAFAAWELTELVSAPIARAPNLRTFATFPTALDLEPANGATLALPFTCHWGLSTKWQLGSVRSGNSYVEDMETDTFAAAVMFAMQDDDWAVLSLKDARWRKAYREACLLHLQLGIVAAGQAHSVSIDMHETVAFGRNLYGVQYAGVMTICTATIRQSRRTGLG